MAKKEGYCESEKESFYVGNSFQETLGNVAGEIPLS